MKVFMGCFLIFFLSLQLEASGKSLSFYESFDSNESIEENSGSLNGTIDFVDGFIGNAGDFSDSRRICYPLQDNLDLTKGTIEFVVKTPDKNSIGFFDVGGLGAANSWGIFKNSNHFIMELKNNSNNYDQAWCPSQITYDDEWHLITAIWEKEDETTEFKVCFDGECKGYYDGSITNSSPSATQFCVGWCGWYGYSQSQIDELNIYDYAKSDDEIAEYYQLNFSDGNAPEITITGNASVVLGIGSQYVDAGATAIDNKDGDVSDKIVTSGSVDTSTLGSYRIAYNVSDADGNPAKEKIRMVYVVDLSIEPVERAFMYLEEKMDQFHHTFDIYTDFCSGGNHGTESGWMGYTEILDVDPKWVSQNYNGKTCFKNIWETETTSWVGIRWLQPENNWGTIEGAGFDLTGATEITFFARGEEGGEDVTFMAGGVSGDYPDSIEPSASVDVVLSKEWEKYTIDLEGEDLSYVISPFGWMVAVDPIFYIDDVAYNLERLDELRFIQSYEIIDVEEEVALVNAAYTYDNALALMCFLSKGDFGRAKILADTFLFALNNDRSYSDGRLRNAYRSGDISDPNPSTAKLPGWWDATAEEWYEDEFQVSTHTGNVAWAMLALISYYEERGGDTYLEAVERMGEWVIDNTKDDRGDGGYTGGYQGWETSDTNTTGPEKLSYKSTEHNIDLYAAFLRLYNATNEDAWLDAANYAKDFIESMWNSDGGYFYTGTLEDGVTTNTSNIPVDIQAWAVMAMPDEELYYEGIDWAESSCYVEKDDFKGFDFNNDLDGVWFEGTAQMALAYLLTDNNDEYGKYISELQQAQISAENANGKGIVSASRDNLTTGFDWEYFSRLHLGATAWYIFAEEGYNPYWPQGYTSNYDTDDIGNNSDNSGDGSGGSGGCLISTIVFQ